LNITIINHYGENEVKCVKLEKKCQICSYVKHYKKKQIRDKKKIRRSVSTEHLYRSPTQCNHLLVRLLPLLPFS